MGSTAGGSGDILVLSDAARTLWPLLVTGLSWFFVFHGIFKRKSSLETLLVDYSKALDTLSSQVILPCFIKYNILPMTMVLYSMTVLSRLRYFLYCLLFDLTVFETFPTLASPCRAPWWKTLRFR